MAVNSDEVRTPPVAGKVIPVLRDVIEAPVDPAPEVRGLSPEQRAALAAESRVILEELLGETLPALEDALRERLQRRISAMLGD